MNEYEADRKRLIHEERKKTGRNIVLGVLVVLAVLAVREFPHRSSYYMEKKDWHIVKIEYYEDGALVQTLEANESLDQEIQEKFGGIMLQNTILRSLFPQKYEGDYIDVRVEDRNPKGKSAMSARIYETGGMEAFYWTFFPYKARHPEVYEYLDSLREN